MHQTIAGRTNYKWWVFGAIAIGSFLSVVDHGSVLVALPDIESHFNADLPTVQWVVVGYALAISVLLLPMGRLGDIVGSKQVYIAGFVVFVLAAALAGTSRWTNLPLLIAAKVLQGVGSAMIQGNGMAMLVSAFPGSERGKALGFHLSVVGFGAIIGPALGGFVVSALGWQWVFFINVPTGLIAIAASLFILREGRPFDQLRVSGAPLMVKGRAWSRLSLSNGRRPAFDWLGAALSGGALLAFLLVVGNGDRIGWASPAIVLGAAAAVALLAAFIWWELRVPSPMLELRLFQRKLLALGVAAGWLSFLGASAVRFLMPFYLQRVLEYSPREVGLIMIPPALCLAILGPISGRLSDQFGWRWFTMGGLALSSVAWFVLAASLTEHSSLFLIISMLTLQSAGTGLFNTPNNSSILSAVERSNYGVVSALTQLVRNSANVTSIALATTVVVVTMRSMGVEPRLDAASPEVASAFVVGLHRAFILLGTLLVGGAAISFVKGERLRETPAPSPRTRAHQ
jgi:MFS family permease